MLLTAQGALACSQSRQMGTLVLPHCSCKWIIDTFFLAVSIRLKWQLKPSTAIKKKKQRRKGTKPESVFASSLQHVLLRLARKAFGSWSFRFIFDNYLHQSRWTVVSNTPPPFLLDTRERAAPGNSLPHFSFLSVRNTSVQTQKFKNNNYNHHHPSCSLRQHHFVLLRQERTKEIRKELQDTAALQHGRITWMLHEMKAWNYWMWAQTSRRAQQLFFLVTSAVCVLQTAIGFSPGRIPRFQWNHHWVCRWPNASTFSPSWQKKPQWNEIVLNHRQYSEMTKEQNSQKITMLALQCVPLVIFISNIGGRTQESGKQDLKMRRWLSIAFFSFLLHEMCLTPKHALNLQYVAIVMGTKWFRNLYNETKPLLEEWNQLY